MLKVMLFIILIHGLVKAIHTWIFILLRKSFLKKNVIAFDINIVLLMIMDFSVMSSYVENSNKYEFLVKCIIQFLFLIIYIFVSMMLYRKRTLLEGTEN